MNSLRKPKLSSTLHKLLKFVAVELPVRPLTPQTKKETHLLEYKFEDIKNLLIVSGKEFRFSKDTKAVSLLKLIIKRSKGITYDEAFSVMDGGVIAFDSKTKDNYYQVCRGIQNKLSKKGVLDFLEYDFNQVKINKNYKKA